MTSDQSIRAIVRQRPDSISPLRHLPYEARTVSPEFQSSQGAAGIFQGVDKKKRLNLSHVTINWGKERRLLNEILHPMDWTKRSTDQALQGASAERFPTFLLAFICSLNFFRKTPLHFICIVFRRELSIR
jgi:hypothetical protein